MSAFVKSKIKELNKSIRVLNKRIISHKDKLSKLQAKIREASLLGEDVSGFEAQYNKWYEELEGFESNLRVQKDQLDSFKEIYNASRGLASEVGDNIKNAFVDKLREIYSRSDLSDFVDRTVRVGRVLTGRNRRDSRVDQFSDSSFEDFVGSGNSSVRVNNVRSGRGSGFRSDDSRDDVRPSVRSVRVSNVGQGLSSGRDVDGEVSGRSIVSEAGLSQSQARDLVQGFGEAVPSIDEGVTGIYKILKKWWDRETRIESVRDGQDSSLLSSLPNILGNGLSGLGGGVSRLGKGVRGIARSVPGFLGKTGVRVAGGLGGLAFAGLDAFAGVKNAKHWLGDRALDSDGNVKLGSKVVSGVSGFLGGEDQGLSGALSGGLKGAGIGMIFGPVGAAIGGAIGAGLGAIGGERIANFVMDAGDGIKSLASKAVDTATSLWDETKVLAKDTWTSVKGVASSVVSSVSSTVDSAISGVKDVASSVLGSVKDVAGSVWTGLKDSFSSVKSVISGVFMDVVDSFKGVFSSIFSGISGLKDKVLSGVDSAFGFVKDKVSGVKDSVKNVVSGVVDGARVMMGVEKGVNYNQVSYPSNAPGYRDVGKLTTQGGDLKLVLDSISGALLSLNSVLGGMNALDAGKNTVVVQAPVSTSKVDQPAPVVVPLNNSSADLQLAYIKGGF